MFRRVHVLFVLICFDKIIRSRNENEITSGKPIRQTSCSDGWFSFGDMCYKAEYGRYTWEQASERCHLDYNGNLIAIHSKELSDFVIAYFLLTARRTMWIGLHDRARESSYIWDDDSSLDYTNWDVGEPSGQSLEKEDCVEMVFTTANSHREMGRWNDGECNQKLPFICQKERGNFNSQYMDPRICSSDIGGGFKHLTSCFHVVNELKTWSDAEEHCIEKFKGHLVTITDLAMELFLDYILVGQKQNLWIGIQMQNRNVLQWSSGWYVAYENWKMATDLCTARHKNGQWTNLSCYKLLPFVCEYSTDVPPTLKPTIEGSTCPRLPVGWKDLGGDYCYYFETESHHTWLEANFLCMKRGSMLVSIHSEDEANILHNFIKFKQNAVYIGLYRQDDGEFAWADGSPLNFTKWDANEPNSRSEHCVEMRTADLKWNDVDCEEEKGYICSIPKISNQTQEQPPEESMTCLSGFSGKTLVGVIFCVVFVAALIGVIMHYFNCFYGKYERFKKSSGAQSESASFKKPKDKCELVINEDV